MAPRFSSVAIIGGTGNVGAYIVDALASAQPAFKSIVLLTRSASKVTQKYPSNVVIKEVDYSSQESLVSALTGIDAVVSAAATQALDTQFALLDAAEAAKVKFFIPSEFGLASNHPGLLDAYGFMFGDKLKLQDRLAALKKEGKMDYALVFTGLWLDWGIDGFLMDVKNKKVELWDGGHLPLSVTSMASIGKTITALVQGKAEGKTEVRVKDINIAQKRLYELAAEVVGTEGWTVTTLETAPAAEEAVKKVKEGTATLDDMYKPVKRAVMSGTCGFPWTPEEDDSELVGLTPWTEKDVLDLIRRLYGKK